MQLLPKDAKNIEVLASTVDFFEYEDNGLTHYYFDTSNYGAPEPMVNAMAGLQLLVDEEKLVMINHKPPMGLFPKIQHNYAYDIEELEDGRHKIIFSLKEAVKAKTDFSQHTCAG